MEYKINLCSEDFHRVSMALRAKGYQSIARQLAKQRASQTKKPQKNQGISLMQVTLVLTLMTVLCHALKAGVLAVIGN